MMFRPHSPELKALNAAKRAQKAIEAHRASILPPPRTDWSRRREGPYPVPEYGFGYARHVTSLALRAGIDVASMTVAHRATLKRGK